MIIVRFATVFLLSTMVSYLIWSKSNRGVVVGKEEASKIQSVSYSPFRRGQSPEKGNFPSIQEMDADLKLLSDYVDGIRIYSGAGALERIPALAKKHGLHVWQGAWLDSNEETNRNEIDAVIRLAKQYPETITRVIVGNENLHRLDMTPETLSSYLDEVQLTVDQPVTYADGWERWLENPEIADAVDIVTIHILPYWENNPLPVEKTMQHVKHILSTMKQTFPDKPIAIGEVGWPSYGRSRQGAVPSIVHQAQFTDGIQTLADQKRLDYNIIEAFDQYWKTVTEGTIGSHWGLFSENRTKKFVAGQAIVPYPHWVNWLMLSSIIAGLLSGTAVIKNRIGKMSVIVQAIITAQVLANLTVLNTIHLWLLGENWSPWMVMSVLQLIFAALLIDTIAQRPKANTRYSQLQDTILLIRRPTAGGERNRPALITVIYHVFAIAAIIVGWGLVIQPRFRDFPTLIFLVPSAGILIAGLLHYVSPLKAWRWVVKSLRMQSRYSEWTLKNSIIKLREETLVSFTLGTSAILIVLGETPNNLEALGFSLTLTLLALPYLGSVLLKPTPN